MLWTFPVLYLLSNVWSLVKHFLAARKSGFPVYVCPTNPLNPFWMVFNVPLRPVLAKILPVAIFERIKPTIYGWEFRDRYAVHAKRGTSFFLATPGTMELWIADEEIANAVLARRNDFVMPEIVGRE
jgi:hypothetical protein